MIAVDPRSKQAQDPVGVVGNLGSAFYVEVQAGDEKRRAEDLGLVGGADDGDAPEVKKPVGRAGQKDQPG